MTSIKDDDGLLGKQEFNDVNDVFTGTTRAKLGDRWFVPIEEVLPNVEKQLQAYKTPLISFAERSAGGMNRTNSMYVEGYTDCRDNLINFIKGGE